MSEIPEAKTLYGALLNAQRAFHSIGKDAKDDKNRAYTSHEVMIHSCSRCLNDAGLVFIVKDISVEYFEPALVQGTKSKYPGPAGRVTLKCVVMHPASNETLELGVEDLPMVTHPGMFADKAAAAASSYALIYIFRNLLMVARGVDSGPAVDARDDGAHASKGAPPPQDAPPPAEDPRAAKEKEREWVKAELAQQRLRLGDDRYESITGGGDFRDLGEAKQALRLLKLAPDAPDMGEAREVVKEARGENERPWDAYVPPHDQQDIPI